MTKIRHAALWLSFSPFLFSLFQFTYARAWLDVLDALIPGNYRLFTPETLHATFMRASLPLFIGTHSHHTASAEHIPRRHPLVAAYTTSDDALATAN